MDDALKSANRRLARKLLLVAVAALGFGFALVPLYNVLCQVTGLNGKTNATAASLPARIDRSRWVTVEFTGNVMPGVSWEFRPTQLKLRVHPGEVVTTAYFARNMTNQPVFGQAVPSVSPGIAAQYFQKLECFCFRHQELKPGEERDMPLTFFVSSDLPEDIREITLSYAFFSLDRGS